MPRMAVHLDTGFAPRGVVLRADARLCVVLFAAVAAFAVGAYAPQLLNDGDTYLHIAAGTRMLAEHAIAYRDPFSATFAGARWDAHEWLAEVLMATAFQWGGWSGLVFLFASSAAAVAGLLAWHLGRWLSIPAQALGVVLALSCMTASLLARPHLLALPLLEIWTAELAIARSEKRSPSFWLLPVMLIWVNIHGSFLLGLALAAALGLEALATEEDRAAVLRTWGLFGAGALLAALCNPHFIQGVLFPFALMGTSSLGNIGEWQPLDLSRPQPLALIVLAAIYFAVTREIKIPPLRAVLVLVLLYMAFAQQRHQIVFAVAAPLLLAGPLSIYFAKDFSPLDERERRLAAIFSTGAIALVIALGAVRLNLPVIRTDSPVAPITALEHVPFSVRSEPVLNDYSFGGYLIFRGMRPFIDSRVELYGDDFLRDYAKIIRPDQAALKEALRTRKIAWTIWSARSSAVSVMDSLSGWHRIYTDGFAVIHIRDK
jgi:hypothetical protein